MQSRNKLARSTHRCRRNHFIAYTFTFTNRFRYTISLQCERFAVLSARACSYILFSSLTLLLIHIHTHIYMCMHYNFRHRANTYTYIYILYIYIFSLRMRYCSTHLRILSYACLLTLRSDGRSVS
jgi:hypothetical protein